MDPALRKPAAKMESRDERITIRFTATQRLMFEEAARAAGEEVSRYIRRCALTGHSLAQAMPLLKGTGA